MFYDDPGRRSTDWQDCLPGKTGVRQKHLKITKASFASCPSGKARSRLSCQRKGERKRALALFIQVELVFKIDRLMRGHIFTVCRRCTLLQKFVNHSAFCLGALLQKWKKCSLVECCGRIKSDFSGWEVQPFQDCQSRDLYSKCHARQERKWRRNDRPPFCQRTSPTATSRRDPVKSFTDREESFAREEES